MPRIYQLSSVPSLLGYLFVLYLIFEDLASKKTLNEDETLFLLGFLITAISCFLFILETFRMVHDKPLTHDIQTTLDAPLELEDDTKKQQPATGYRLRLGWLTGPINILTGLGLIIGGLFLIVEISDKTGQLSRKYMMGIAVIMYFTCYGALQIYYVIHIMRKVIASQKLARAIN